MTRDADETAWPGGSEDTGPALRAHADALDDLDRLAARFGRSLAGALGDGAAKGRDLDVVLKSLARSLLGLGRGGGSGGLGDLLGGLAASLAGALLRGGGGGFGGGVGGVTPFAKGGIVASPVAFPLGRGQGLMGEAGAEAILPLARGPDGRLGVRAGADRAPVTINVAITTPDADSFRRSEGQVAAALARAVARGRRVT